MIYTIITDKGEIDIDEKVVEKSSTLTDYFNEFSENKYIVKLFEHDTVEKIFIFLKKIDESVILKELFERSKNVPVESVMIERQKILNRMKEEDADIQLLNDEWTDLYMKRMKNDDQKKVLMSERELYDNFKKKTIEIRSKMTDSEKLLEYELLSYFKHDTIKQFILCCDYFDIQYLKWLGIKKLKYYEEIAYEKMSENDFEFENKLESMNDTINSIYSKYNSVKTTTPLSNDLKCSRTNDYDTNKNLQITLLTSQEIADFKDDMKKYKDLFTLDEMKLFKIYLHALYGKEKKYDKRYQSVNCVDFNIDPVRFDKLDFFQIKQFGTYSEF